MCGGLGLKTKVLRLLLPWAVYGVLIFSIERLYDILSGTFSIDKLISKTIGLFYMRDGFVWPYDASIQGNMMGGFGPS